MNGFWFKFKVYLKLICFGVLALYILSFVIANTGRKTELWFWYGNVWNTSVLLAVVGSFVAGIIFALLFGTIFKTYRQISDLRRRNRTARLEREMEDMRNKASRLQTRKP